VERLEPDELLQSFAPDANRVSLSRMASDLDRYCTMAGANTIGYLSRITTPLTLQRLTQVVETLGSRAPLELIVSHLPEQENNDQVRVLRKRLSQWINQGLLVLYRTKENHSLTFCFSSQLPHRTALQLQIKNNGEPTEWFQTRSERGVNQVFQDLQSLKSNAIVIPESTLEDSDTVVISPTPNWGSLTLEQLRKELGLAQVLRGGQIKKMVYSDRYLNQPGAEILAELFHGMWLNHASQQTIQILQSKEEYDRGDTQRRVDIERFLSNLPGKVDVEMRPYPKRCHPPFPHQRELTIEFQNNSTYRILFDKGLDFLKKSCDGKYVVKENSYVVIQKLS